MRKLFIATGIILALLVATSIQSLAGENEICFCVDTKGKVRIATDSSQCKKKETFRCWSFIPSDQKCPDGEAVVGFDLDGNIICSSTVQCIDADEDSYYAVEGCGTLADCDDEDPDVNPGTEEICDDIDNNCDGNIDEGCAECGEGETRECGSDVGECVPGIQTCIEGSWGECEGQIGPFPEICDNRDNDCDGQEDEECAPPDGTPCDDQNFCTENDAYLNGYCVGGPLVDCDDSDPCTYDSCSFGIGCEYTPVTGNGCN